MTVWVDGLAALAQLRTVPSCDPGYCLRYVWNAYAAVGAVADGTYPTAYSAWQGSRFKRPDDMNPPAGFPVYLGPRSGSSAGDVFISTGNGRGYGTDWPSNGRLGEFTIAQRMAQTGRPYLGWTEDILSTMIRGDGFPPDENSDVAGRTALGIIILSEPEPIL